MNVDEAIVKRYLERIGHTDVRSHPDGSHNPPDFLLDDSVAIEVRRLNLHYQNANRLIPLEQNYYPLLGHLNNLFKSINKPEIQDWLVFCEFSRPVADWRNLHPQIMAACNEIGELSVTLGTTFHAQINPRLKLTFRRSSIKLKQKFSLSGLSDLNEGCMIYDALRQNIQLCIDEKTQKIQRHYEKYSRWHLLLVDHIDYCMSQEEQIAAKDTIKNIQAWEKILLLSPLDSGSIFQIYP